MLRGNKRKIGYLQRTLGSQDPKTELMPNVSVYERFNLFQYIKNDPRILFVCLDYPDFIEHVQAITGNDKQELDESLDKYVSEIVNAKV